MDSIKKNEAKATVTMPLEDYVATRDEAIIGNNFQQQITQSIQVSVGTDYREQPCIRLSISYDFLFPSVKEALLTFLYSSIEARKLMRNHENHYLNRSTCLLQDYDFTRECDDLFKDPTLASLIKQDTEDEKSEQSQEDKDDV